MNNEKRPEGTPKIVGVSITTEYPDGSLYREMLSGEKAERFLLSMLGLPVIPVPKTDWERVKLN